jgi:hypothetical protein
MTVIYCDITGDEVPAGTTNFSWATREQRYQTLLDKDLSPAGRRKLDQAVYEHFSDKEKFDFMEWKSVQRESLQKLAKT